ncbi:MAG: hypothetical protein ACE5G0_18640 [Rhodothermales bacterium]
MTDPVREYLSRHGYAAYIVEGGLDYLLDAWETMVAAVSEGQILDRNQFISGMDLRRILEETLAFIPLYEQAGYYKRVIEADQKIRQHLVASETPLCDQEMASIYGYTPERHWWYFYRPRQVNETWPVRI